MDTYQRQRHPVAARALQHTMAQAALQRRDERIKALAAVVSELTSMDEPRKRLAVLIRPDGYVAWVGGQPPHVGLPDALTTWFGART